MLKKATSGVLSRSVSSRTGVRFHLRQGFGGHAGDFAPSGWGSVRGIHGAAFAASWSQMQGASPQTMLFHRQSEATQQLAHAARTLRAHGACGWIPRRSSSTMHHIASSSLLVCTSQDPYAQPRALLGQTPTDGPFDHPVVSTPSSGSTIMLFWTESKIVSPPPSPNTSVII